jgi:hypothetical protein
MKDIVQSIRLFLIDRGFPLKIKTIPEMERMSWYIARRAEYILDKFKTCTDIVEIKRGRIGLRKYWGPEDGSVWYLGDNGHFLNIDKGRK